ncbi:hypothetical protein C7444_11162 [Sphaerotilus hippei]|uniref:Uncharacterized protein n=1 Tax=Sphaerotilus hippei TaxID=744406 RepID=A0A318H2I7_9BURK|nr:hypothetical protein [Sphaerotilus hippei]PXW94979.1 hypothetical protein C7444_11162 [Sphaerotilus hippei]
MGATEVQKAFLELTTVLTQEVQALHRQSVADRMLIHALIQTHPDSGRLLMDVMDRMDTLAPQLGTSAILEQSVALRHYLQHLSDLQS